MNDLGFALVWLALQVACLLAPAAVLQLLASRRGPASGAWVATWSLGLAAGLGIVTLVTWAGSAWGPIQSIGSTAPAIAIPIALASVPLDAAATEKSSRAEGFPLLDLHWPATWEGLGRHATGPVTVVRAWGRAFALVGLGGMALGLLRLLLGLWAIRLCRRRGAPIDDPAMIGLVEELRMLTGCRRSVEVLEVRDLATPATAGWQRPLLLLPSGWRRWGDSERRAGRRFRQYGRHLHQALRSGPAG
jgi:hypothetical protein